MTWNDRLRAWAAEGKVPQIAGGGRYAVPIGQRAQKFRQKLGNIAYVSGTSPGMPGGLPKSDYLCGIDLISAQTVVVGATAPVNANYGAYGPLSMVAFKVGAKSPFSLPAYHVNEYNKIWNHGYMDALAASPILTNTTNNWKNHLRVPLVVDWTSEVGCWYTGDLTLSADLRLSMSPASTVFSTVNGATIGGSWDVWGIKFSAPAPGNPNGWLNEISYYKEVTLYQSVQLKNGTTTIPLDIDKDYLRIIGICYTGTSYQDATFAPATGLYNWLDLAVDDKTHVFEQIDEATMRFNMLQTYGDAGQPVALTVGPGTWCLDFVEQPIRRDILPADGDVVKTLMLRINSSNASAFVDIITEAVYDSPHAVKYAHQAAQHAATRRAA